MASPMNANGKGPVEDATQNHPPAKKLIFDFKEIVTVVVGSDKEQFNVHKDVICRHSAFFKAACSNAWVERRTREIKLQEQSSNAFALYLAWAYSPTSKIFPLVSEQLQDSPAYSQESDDVKRLLECCGLFWLWMLADFLGDTACGNAVIDSLIQENAAKTICDLEFPLLTSVVYGDTAPGSALRRWLVATILPRLTPDELKLDLEEYHRDLVNDLLEAAVAQSGGIASAQPPKMSDASKYHV